MRNKALKLIIKTVSFIAVFCVIFAVLQQVLTPKYRAEGTLFSSEFFGLEKNSVDVLFLGSSQITCGVDAPRLAGYYDIPAFNFCVSGASFDIEEYYLKEALETQSPKLVIADAGNIFVPDEEFVSRLQMSYFYPTMPLDKYKIESLYNISDGDLGTVFSYSFPLFLYASRWKELTADDFTFYTKYKYLYVGGFLRRARCTPVTLSFFSGDEGTEREISDRKGRAVDRISEICKENGIRLMFIKIPSPDWTRTDSRLLKEFMTAHSLDFVDLNDYTEEIGLDPDQDFFDELHLNMYGAAKTTDHLAGIIQERLETDMPKEML